MIIYISVVHGITRYSYTVPGPWSKYMDHVSFFPGKITYTELDIKIIPSTFIKGLL